LKSRPTIVGFVLLLSACGDDAGSPNPSGDELPTATVYALGSDSASSGILSRFDLPNTEATVNVVAGVVASDSVMRVFDDKLYIINRFGSDNITIVDTATNSLIAQLSTGAGTNPQDVAVVGSRLYICAFNTSGILVMDAEDPDGPVDTIDLSAYDPDGIPDCASIIAHGDKLYATFGLLDPEFVSHGGKVVVIDSTTDQVETDFDLSFNNPFGFIISTGAGSDSAFDGDLLVQTTEDFGDGNGCIERVTPGAAPGSSGCLIENPTLGGYVSVLQASGDTVWAAVNASPTVGKVVAIAAGGEIDAASLTAASQHPTDLAICPTGHLITNDRNDGTLHVYDANGEELTTEPLDVGLPSALANGIACF
jgi:YVTN family beta-propeller protein